MKEVQFNPLPSQGNIYSNTRLGRHLIMGAGDSGKVYAHFGSNLMQPLPLQSLPYECDVISVDAYIDSFPVLAVAYVQRCGSAAPGSMPDGKGRGYVTSHLNIYSTWISVDQDSPTSTTSSSSSSAEGGRNKPTFHPKEEFHASQFDLLAQNCSMFQLNFIPYHLYHIPVVKENGNFGNILLLSGSDRKIHSYEADEDNLAFNEVPVKTYFPELAQTFPSLCTRVLIEPVNDLTRRITMCGLESGKLLIWVVSSKFHRRRRMDSEQTVTSGSATPSKSMYGGSVPESETSDKGRMSSSMERSVGGFSVSMDSSCGEEECMTESMLDSFEESFQNIQHHFEGFITSIKSYYEGFNLNIIVASALSPTYVYTNVIEENFKAGSALKFSSRWDVVECCCCEDVDRDGENEIIIGTYGCALLVYKYMDEILPEWVIVAKKKFSKPVLAVEFVNPNLHVVTGMGLHIINYDTCAYFSNKPGPLSLSVPYDQRRDELEEMKKPEIEDKEVVQ